MTTEDVRPAKPPRPGGHRKKRLGIAPAPTGSWENFQPGHTVNMTHGTRTPAVFEPVADVIIAELLGSPDCPEFLSRPMFRWSLRGWAVAEAKLVLIEMYMESLGMDLEGIRRQVSATGAQAPLVMHWKQLSEHAARLRARNGLDPVSFAKLGKALTSQNLDIARIVAAAAKSEGWDSGD